MNKEQTTAAAHVMLSFASGQPVQQRSFRMGEEWINETNPTWNWTAREYRIKPPPPSPREFWVDPEMIGFPLSAFPVDGGRPQFGRFIKVREVLE